MKLPMSWLAEFVDMTGISNKEYADKMTMSGSKVEEVVYLGDEIQAKFCPTYRIRTLTIWLSVR